MYHVVNIGFKLVRIAFFGVKKLILLTIKKKMKTTTIGSYPKPSYLKISDWFQGKDNSPEDWEKTWSLLGNKKK